MPEEPDVNPEEEEILDRNIRKRIEARKQQREREAALQQKRESEHNGASKAKEPAQAVDFADLFEEGWFQPGGAGSRGRPGSRGATDLSGTTGSTAGKDHCAGHRGAKAAAQPAQWSGPGAGNV